MGVTLLLFSRNALVLPRFAAQEGVPLRLRGCNRCQWLVTDAASALRRKLGGCHRAGQETFLWCPEGHSRSPDGFQEMKVLFVVFRLGKAVAKTRRMKVGRDGRIPLRSFD